MARMSFFFTNSVGTWGVCWNSCRRGTAQFGNVGIHPLTWKPLASQMVRGFRGPKCMSVWQGHTKRPLRAAPPSPAQHLQLPVLCDYDSIRSTDTFPWITLHIGRRVQLKCDGTRWRTRGEVKEKLENGVGIQHSSHYLGTWCIQHYYRWCAQFSCQ